jgi:glycerol-3-phosphate acyltransferase PlsX
MIKGAIMKANLPADHIQSVQQTLQAALHPFNYEHVGGIPFLGVNGVSIVGHGGSTPLAIKNMINSAVNCVESDLNGKIVASLN